MRQWLREKSIDFSTAGELLGFVWRGKHWWLTPIIVVILLLTSIVVFLEGSAVTPFIYALF